MLGEDQTNVNPRRGRIADERERSLALRFAEALRAGDGPGAETVCEAALQAGLDVAAVHSRVVAPAMQRIGDLWQRGAVSIADEHLATAISHNVLSRLFPRVLRAQPRSRARVMLAAAQGEMHVLGLRMAADVLEGAGFDVISLGADVPVIALLEACRKHTPAVLGLSVTMPLNVPAFIQAIEAVQELDNPPAVMVAGAAARKALEQGLCAPLVEHSDQVVATVDDLLAHPQREQLVPSALALKLPDAGTGGEMGTGTLLTRERAFVDTTVAAAEIAREAGRRAYEFERLAYHDPLTGLWNRRAYDDRLYELTAGGSSAGSILMIDIDAFKSINDTHGHAVADRVLCDVARAMLHGVRPGDFAARYGGDEFAILLPGAGLEKAVAIGERVRSGVERDVRDPSVTISVGVAPLTVDLRDTALAADRALYDAKKSGRNRVMARGG